MAQWMTYTSLVFDKALRADRALVTFIPQSSVLLPCFDHPSNCQNGHSYSYLVYCNSAPQPPLLYPTPGLPTVCATCMSVFHYTPLTVLTLTSTLQSDCGRNSYVEISLPSVHSVFSPTHKTSLQVCTFSCRHDFEGTFVLGNSSLINWF